MFHRCLIILWLKAPPCPRGPCTERANLSTHTPREMTGGSWWRLLGLGVPSALQGARLGRLVNPCLRRASCHLAAVITDHFCHLSLLHLPHLTWPYFLWIFFFFPFKSWPELRERHHFKNKNPNSHRSHKGRRGGKQWLLLPEAQINGSAPEDRERHSLPLPILEDGKWEEYVRQKHVNICPCGHRLLFLITHI